MEYVLGALMVPIAPTDLITGPSRDYMQAVQMFLFDFLCSLSVDMYGQLRM